MPQKKSRIILFFLIIPLAIAGFWFSPHLKSDNKNDEGSRFLSAGFLKFDNTKIKVEIADSQIERQLGLSGRDTLADNTGLFFVFDKEDFYHIWMKDMNFPIDVMWMDSQGTVVNIKSNISPSTYPQTFTSDKPAKFILEMPAGWASRNIIKVGDKTDAQALVK